MRKYTYCDQHKPCQKNMLLAFDLYNLSWDVRKPVFRVSDQLSQPEQSQNYARCLKFWNRHCTICVVKTKALISCTADLRLCFCLGKLRFSHDATHLKINMHGHQMRSCCDSQLSGHTVPGQASTRQIANTYLEQIPHTIN